MLFALDGPVKIGFLSTRHSRLSRHRIPPDLGVIDQQRLEEAFGGLTGLGAVTVGRRFGLDHDLFMRVSGLMSAGSTLGFRSYVASPFCSCSTSVSCV